MDDVQDPQGRRRTAQDGRSQVARLVASCPTFEDATATVDELNRQGVPRQALSIAAEGVSAVTTGGRRDSGAVMVIMTVSGFLAGAGTALMLDLSARGLVIGAAAATLGAICGALNVRRRCGRRRAEIQLVAVRYYVVSDEKHAEKARKLVHPGALRPHVGLGRSIPCIGSLPATLAHPSSGPATSGAQRRPGHLPAETRRDGPRPSSSCWFWPPPAAHSPTS